MTEIIQNLENNLRSQTQGYKKLTHLEKEKQHALVNNKIQEIEVITAQEEKILIEVSRLEEDRLRWAEFFGKEIGKKAEEITLTELAENYPVLDGVREELEAEILELKNLHETNARLLESAVNLVNFTIETLTGEMKATYSNPADKSGRKGSKNISFIDKSV